MLLPLPHSGDGGGGGGHPPAPGQLLVREYEEHCVTRSMHVASVPETTTVL